MNNIYILLPTYNRAKQCLKTILQLVSAIDIFIKSCDHESAIQLICSENNSNTLELLIPERPYIIYITSPDFLSMPQNIANTMKLSGPGFFWIIPDDDIIDESDFVRTLNFLYSTSADIVNITYSIVSNRQLRICKQPSFLLTELKRLSPPFMLLSSLAFKLSSHQQVLNIIQCLESSHNMYAQNLIFNYLPSHDHLLVCSLNAMPIIYNDVSGSRFSCVQAVDDATDIVFSLSKKYGIDNFNTQVECKKVIIRNNLKGLVRSSLHYPLSILNQKDFYIKEFDHYLKLTFRYNLWFFVCICAFYRLLLQIMR